MANKNTTTKYYKFKGQVSYAKVYDPDEYNGQTMWKINFYPENIDKVKATGIQNKWKDDDGEKSGVFGKYVNFSRPTEKEYAGLLTKFPPPEILDAKGDKLVSYEKNPDGTFERIGDPISIGNGSVVEIELEVYETKRFGKGSRFLRVRIIDLVEYNPPEDVSENEIDFEEDTSPPFETDVVNEELTRPAVKSTPVAKTAAAKPRSTKVSW